MPVNPDCRNVTLWSGFGALAALILPVPTLLFARFAHVSGTASEIVGWLALLVPVWGGAFAGAIAGWSAYRRATIARGERFTRFVIPAFFLNAATGFVLALVSGVIAFFLILERFGY